MFIKRYVSFQSLSDRAKGAVFAVCLSLTLFVSQGRCDDDLRSLELYNGTETEIISGNRSPRPASQTAENITVVTAGDIGAINAHTLADILSYVTGVQVEMVRTPGTPGNFEVQGSNFNHVLLLLDGVPINNLADNYPDFSQIPVQMIERVEIVKGAASSAWGNALGGVINVITKFPDPERAVGGMVSASLGQRDTTDTRVELSGAKDRFGYYLTGGKLRSDGLLPNNRVNRDTFYGKLQYDLPSRGLLTLTTALSDGKAGMYGSGPNTVDTDNLLVVSTLSAHYQLMDHLTIETSLVGSKLDSEAALRALARSGAPLTAHYASDESRRGINIKLSWLDNLQRLVAGIDYEHVTAHVINPIVEADNLDRSADRVGIYLSDTLTLRRFAVTPSARFDSTGSAGDHFSPSLGVTYALSDNTVLRGYSSKGYGLTSLARSVSTEKVWTSQFGLETGEIPYLWFKATLFRNDTSDVRTSRSPSVALQRILKEGVELEAKTLPFWNTSLSTGYTYVRGTQGGDSIKGIPKHTAQVGIRYQNPDALQADLNGRYIDWGQSDTGKFGSIIWDLHLRKTVELAEISLEFFGSIRNLFNDAYYLDPRYRNPGRWGEAGVRCNF